MSTNASENDGAGDQNGAAEGRQEGAGAGAAGAGAGGNGDQRGNTGSAGDAQDVSALPDWAQKLIRDGRQEAASNRVKGKESGRAEVLETLAKALGLKEDEKPDPAKLAEDLKSKDGALREARTQLAVLKMAGKVKADPEAVLDSNSTMAKIGKLDPDSDDYEAEVQRVLKDAVASNPRLGIGTPAGSSGRDMSGGNGGRSLDEKVRDGDASPEDIKKIAREASRRRF